MEEENFSDNGSDVYEENDNSDIFDDKEVITMEELLSATDNSDNISYNSIYEEYLDKPKTTLPILSKYEKCLVLGVRTTQLSKGANPLIETEGIDISEIALKELENNKLPYIIKRPINQSNIEYWRLAELALK